MRSGDKPPRRIPRASGQLALDFRASERLTFMRMSLFSSRSVRTQQREQWHRGRGTFTDQFGATRTFDGSGKVDGYAIFNLTKHCVARNWEVFRTRRQRSITEYETAVPAENPFDAANQFQT
ncbi:MAG: hypothetical protein KIS79_05945 [Burkholderiales bacterium]|nr:hypothetical protein [Burkholderiales bacterium]MCW5620630.1 hypothetical protein [Burkholderiales bacterium]